MGASKDANEERNYVNEDANWRQRIKSECGNAREEAMRSIQQLEQPGNKPMTRIAKYYGGGGSYTVVMKRIPGVRTNRADVTGEEEEPDPNSPKGAALRSHRKRMSELEVESVMLRTTKMEYGERDSLERFPTGSPS